MKPHHVPVMTVVFSLVLLFGTKHVPAETIRFGYIEFPPYTYTDDQGKPAGILVDLANKIIPHAGYEPEFFSFPVRRLASYIGSGDLDVWMGLKTLPEFEGKTYIGSTVVAELILRAYFKGKKNPIRVKEEMIGKSIIVLRGYSYGGWTSFIEDPKNTINHIKANTHEAAFNMLKADRAEYVLDYKEPSDMALRKITIPNLSHNQISALPCYIVVSRANPNGRAILENLEKSYHILKEQGTLD